MFDEQPDGDPHGECAAAIHELQALLTEAYKVLLDCGIQRGLCDRIGTPSGKCSGTGIAVALPGTAT